jgi:predicted dehydrogenase
VSTSSPKRPFSFRRAEVVAVANPSPLESEKFEFLKVFASGEALVRSGLVDAVIIVTPRYPNYTR